MSWAQTAFRPVGCLAERSQRWSAQVPCFRHTMHRTNTARLAGAVNLSGLSPDVRAGASAAEVRTMKTQPALFAEVNGNATVPICTLHASYVFEASMIFLSSCSCAIIVLVAGAVPAGVMA